MLWQFPYIEIIEFEANSGFLQAVTEFVQQVVEINV
jgi:hypothetical protein